MIHDHHACHLKGVLVDRGGLEIMKWLRIPVKSVLHLMQRSSRNRSISYTFPNFKNSNLEDRLYISMLVFTDSFCCIVHCNERTSLSFILLLYWFNISYEREEPNLCSTYLLFEPRLEALRLIYILRVFIRAFPWTMQNSASFSPFIMIWIQ